MLSGIGDVVSRSDLLDRSILQHLPTIPDDKRRCEAELIAELEEARPAILGGVLDAAVIALREYSNVRLSTLPRMADFAMWSVAAEPAHSPQKVFLKAYYGNRTETNDAAIETSVIGPTLLEFLDGRDSWHGLMKELLAAMNLLASESVRKLKSWPSIERSLKNQLTRLAPNLLQAGISVTFEKHTNKGTPVTLERVVKSSSPSSPSSPAMQPNGLCGDDVSADGIRSSPSSLPSSPAKSIGINGSDDSDDNDDENVPNLIEEEII